MKRRRATHACDKESYTRSGKGGLHQLTRSPLPAILSHASLPPPSPQCPPPHAVEGVGAPRACHPCKRAAHSVSFLSILHRPRTVPRRHAVCSPPGGAALPELRLASWEHFCSFLGPYINSCPPGGAALPGSPGTMWSTRGRLPNERPLFRQ